MRIVRIVDQILLLVMSILLLMELFFWSTDSVKYVFIFYFVFRWVVIPLALMIQKRRRDNGK